MENISKGFKNWQGIARIPSADNAIQIWSLMVDDWTYHKDNFPDRVPAGFENCSLEDLEFTSHPRKDRLLARPAGTKIPFHIWRGALQGFNTK